VNGAGPERGGQAVAALGEDEERIRTDGLDVAVGGRRLVRAVDRALGAVEIQDQPPRERAGRLMLHEVRIEASESPVVRLLREDVRVDPVQRGCERDARLPPLAGDQHSNGGVRGQPLRIVGALVPCQAALDGLSEQVRRREWTVTSRAGIGEVSLDQGAQTEPLVPLAGPQQPGVGGHRRTPELDAEVGIEREATRASFRVTHWVVPSVPARRPREPRFLRVLSDLWPGSFTFQIENAG
jgi:hypothetical protein